MPRANPARRRAGARRLGLLCLEDRALPATLIGLNSTGDFLLPFSSTNPGVLLPTVPISGLRTNEAIQAMDFRPATGQLFALGTVGTSARIGTLNPATGAFSQVGGLFTLSAASFGLDFNPTNDLIRVTDNVGHNLAINPNDGNVTTQTTLNPGTPSVVDSAYSNSFPNATTTTLYDIDSTTDQLLIQNPPASGTLTPVGPLGVNTATMVGFDIAGNGTAYASLNVGGSSQLYTINLTTGAATLVGSISPSAITLRDMAVMRSTWSGGGANPNWTIAANWLGNIAPVAGDDLIFPAGAAQIATSNNNFAANTSFNSITFTGSAFTLGGNAIMLRAGILDSAASGVNTMNLDMTLTATQVTSVANSGELLIWNGAISGAAGVILNKELPGATTANAGSLRFASSANNALLGTVVVNGGRLELAKTGGSSAIVGGLLIGDGTGGAASDVVREINGNNIDNAVNVTIASSGALQFNAGVSDTVSSVTMTGGAIDTTSGTLTVAGTLTAASDSSGRAASIFGRLSLVTGAVVVNLGAGTADLNIGAVILGSAGLNKNGAGDMQLTGTSANTYSGVTIVADGTVELGKSAGNAIPGALIVGDGIGTTGSATVRLLANDQIADASAVTINTDGTISGGLFGDTIGTLTMTGGSAFFAGGALTISSGSLAATSDAAGNAATIAGTLNLGGFTTTLTVDDGPGGVDLNISAAIVNGGVQKQGAGTLRFSGTTPNTFLQTTFVNEGILELAKVAGVDAIAGTLVIGDNTGPDFVRLLDNNQINNAANVQVFAGGRFDLNGFADAINNLQLRTNSADSGQVTTGAGTLALVGNISVIVNGTGAVGATIAGQLAFTLNDHTIDVADGAAAADLDISAAIVGAGGTVFKSGAGQLVVSGTASNTFAGTIDVADGTLFLNKTGGVIAIGGPLVIDGGDVAELQNNQVGDTSPIQVNTGGTFDLNGAVDTVGSFTVAGGIVLTNGGRLTAGDTSFDSNSILNMTLVDSANSDRISVVGSVTLGGILQLQATTTPPSNSVILLIDNDGTDSITGTFFNLPEGGVINVAGTTFQITYHGGTNNNDVVLTAVTDTFPPTVTIDQSVGQADPTNSSPILFTVVFDEPVVGFTGSDISFAGSTVGGTLVANVSGVGPTYTVSVTGMNGVGTVVASIPAGVVQDLAGNPNEASTSTDNIVTFDSVAPTVTINQAAGQADPTNASPILFTVVFSESVTGFTASNVNFTGSTNTGALVAQVSGSGSTYTVSVTGMTGNGTVVASIGAGAAQDAAGNSSTTSTSTDNTVTFDAVAPTVTINQAAGQHDPTNSSPILFTVVFSESVTGFDADDIDLSTSTAGGNLIAQVTGSGSTYTVSVTGMTSTGTVAASVIAGAAQDAAGNLSLASTSADNEVTFRTPLHLFAVGAGPGKLPLVRAYNADGTLHISFLAYAAAFAGGVSVAIGDVNGDGSDDIITGAGFGGGPHVKVFDGVSGAVLYSFFPYSTEFRGGVFVGVGDVNGDGFADIITGAGAGGGPHVEVFSGRTGALLDSFLAYNPAFSGGVNVAGGDINHDGHADIITGAGPGGGPHVEVFSGLNLALLRSFLAYAPNFSGGVFVGAGDINADGFADIITGAGKGGNSHVEVFSGGNQSLLASFFAYPGFTGGVRVAGTDLNGDGHADIITGEGPAGEPRVKAFSGVNLAPLQNFLAFDPAYVGGIYVG